MDTVEREFNALCQTPSDINEHLATLSRYASTCDSVFETGVRGCISSWALVHGLLQHPNSNKRIFMNDISPCYIHHLLNALEPLPIKVEYAWIDNLKLPFTEPVDLTFIDTWHVYPQLKRELAKFAPLTNKYIIMHDTTVDAEVGETVRCNYDAVKQSADSGFPIDEICKGLWPAVEEFLTANPEWALLERYTNNNGLTVLHRLPRT